MRRTHTKSRKGCTNCKRRKVKCDEVYPICFNCKRHQVPCSLSEPTPAPVASEDGSRSSSKPPPPQTPRSEVTEVAGGSAVGSPTEPGPSLAEQIAPLPPQELWSCDMELMHHYITITADSMSVRPEMCHVWRVGLPREGYRYPFVTHGILAVAASHKAYLMPNSRKKYLSLSDYHQAVGSEMFRSALESVDSDNERALFSFASVLVLYVMALPQRSLDGRLVDPIHHFMELLGLFRGFKTTLASLIPAVLRSEFSPLIYGIWPLNNFGMPERCSSLEHSLLPTDTWVAIQNLHDFLKAELPSASCSDYTATIGSLEECAKLIAVAGAYVEVGAIMAWIHLAKESVLLDIAAHHPHGLLTLAYYCVFWATLDKTFWYARGWPRQLFDAIEAELIGQERFMKMLQWPRQSIASMGL